LQPVYALNGTAELGETIAAALSGYRRMGPVRVGNLAFIQAQNDVYGSAILA
jgi:GH15 family glucan-1,4-alpha-glucosidase